MAHAGEGIVKRLKSILHRAYPVLHTLNIDGIFRFCNREKVLTLAYHGVTQSNFSLPCPTLIPVDIFEEQIAFLSAKYKIVSLRQIVQSLAAGEKLPQNAAVITFDDGYKNNLTLALPILEKYHVPATIFVTAGYVGQEKILPMDEAYFLVIQAKGRPSCSINEIGLGPLYFESTSQLVMSYKKIVSTLKQFHQEEQKRYIHLLRELLHLGPLVCDASTLAEFGIVSREELRTLSESSLIDIGAHTVNHQILSRVDIKIAAEEIIKSKCMLQEYTGKNVDLFAYPNGAAGDYNNDHIAILKKNGFICSVTLDPKMNTHSADLNRLGRVCVGYDFAFSRSEFAMKTSGSIHAIKSFLRNNNV
jgi:peptidoglycan/xylan/chitin deacetylase (PgdA/CDA1 family)